jgi:ribosomal protein S10
MPRSLAALYLKPLRREAEYGVPSCDLQLRSYTLRNLEFFCDFALRAAYYLGLPAYGPVPLPRMTERWTVPRSTFIFKKSQENFERITLRRLIQIRDGHPETVQIWLAFLQKHAYYGIGMKANVWEFSKLGTLSLLLLIPVKVGLTALQVLARLWTRVSRRWRVCSGINGSISGRSHGLRMIR